MNKDKNTDWSEHMPEKFEFRGKWVDNWFSNMALSPLKMGQLIFPSVENYYQGMKSETVIELYEFTKMTPSKSKFEGRRIKIRPNWEDIKYDVMKSALLVKFNQPEWKEKLMATGDDVIVEWNNWGDKIWGATINDGLGANALGQILMEIRKTFNG